MPNTLTEKAMKQPFRVGLMLGALTLPGLWVVSQDVIRTLLRESLLNLEEVTTLFAMGFLPGMVLGAGALCAWVAWREGKKNGSRRLLIVYGAFVTVGLLTFGPAFLGSHSRLSYLLARPPQGWESPITFYVFLFYDVLPFQIAIAMLLFGLFMRGSRT